VLVKLMASLVGERSGRAAVSTKDFKMSELPVVIHGNILRRDNSNGDYVIGGNLCDSVVLGSPGVEDDFFLIGVPSLEEEGHPLITGNFLDSEGNPLFLLVQNTLVVNPSHCSKVTTDGIGYEIHDSNGKPIFKVKTAWEADHNAHGRYVTRLEGTFFGKGGKVVCKADDELTASPGLHFAIGSMFGNLTPEEIETARVLIMSGGAIHERLSGTFVDHEIQLDGKLLTNVTLSDCRLHVKFGTFLIGDNVTMKGCKIVPEFPASQVLELIKVFSSNNPVYESGFNCNESGKYRYEGCGHSAVMVFARGEALPSCPQCQKAVRWAKVA